MVYNVGVWESASYAECPPEELAHVIDASLRGAILLVHALLTEIRSGAGSLIAIGSTSGLENEGSAAVAYTAAKFGLRGACEAWRENLRTDGVRVSCINIGSTATDIGLGNTTEALSRYAQRRIPVDDVVHMIAAIRLMSPATCVKTVTMPAQYDTDA